MSKHHFPASGPGTFAPLERKKEPVNWPESTSALSSDDLCSTCSKIPQDMFHSDVPREEKATDLGLVELKFGKCDMPTLSTSHACS